MGQAVGVMALSVDNQESDNAHAAFMHTCAQQFVTTCFQF